MGVVFLNSKLYEEIVSITIRNADPIPLLREIIRREEDKCFTILGNRECLSSGGKIYVIGAGKASGRMAIAVEDILGELIGGGVVAVPKYMAQEYRLERIRIIGSGHPIPDENSVSAAEEALHIVETLGGNDVLLALISGGGSALMEKPIPPIRLEDLIVLNKLLLNSGADIEEINIVRKHLSMIKGGRLAVKASNAKRIYSLMISDVPGDNPEYIASGPTVPDSSTYRDARDILLRYKLWDRIPESIREVIVKGLNGEIPETPKRDHPVFRRVINKIIASNYTVLKKLSEYLESRGYKSYILTTRLMGESREVGKALASIALDISDRRLLDDKPVALLLGGETTVTLGEKYGRGGRCQELVLSFLTVTRNRRDISIISFDTDGIDGYSDAAGAYGDYKIWERMSKLGDNPWRYLFEHNAYDFFKKYGGLIITGPTGTNVNMVVAILINPALQDN
jgi:glycerate 2-kinase